VTQWEYKTLGSDLPSLDRVLSESGAECWELVSVAPLSGSRWIAILKRPLRQTKTPAPSLAPGQ